MDNLECLPPCSGMILTSFSKMESEDNIEQFMPDLVAAYKNYTKWSKFPSAIKGFVYLSKSFYLINSLLLTEFEWQNKLRFVKIYFDTPTFDRITKDRAAKFVDVISAIGGTMGLLTGFSIMSGIEILYFATKIIVKIMRNKIE